jgi:hypothetical protein
MFYERQQMACILIRNTIDCVSCSVEWGLASYFVTYFVIRLYHKVQEGLFAGILSTASGGFVGETVAKHDILL